MRTVVRSLIPYLFVLFISVTAYSQMVHSNSATQSIPQPFVCPFHFQIELMERLLLINFEKDPDITYIGFEPQVFNDEVMGTGMLVIGWRVDGKVDVYHEPTLKPNSETYNITGKGLANMVETNLGNAFFEVNDQGVQADIAFQCMEGRAIKISISEQNKSKHKPFGLLAPMGDAAENPSAMPLVLLHDFYFVRRKRTHLEVSIDGRLHKPDKMPMAIDWTSMYFTRYSPDPFIVTFNPAHNGPAKIVVPDGKKEVEKENSIYTFSDVNGRHSLKSIKTFGDGHSIVLSFDPAFPNIANLENEFQQSGQFLIQGHASTGKVSGQYELTKVGNEIKITIHPSGGWHPVAPKLSLKFLYAVGKVFKNWPKTYQWTAILKQNDRGIFIMNSDWDRIQ